MKLLFLGVLILFAEANFIPNRGIGSATASAAATAAGPGAFSYAFATAFNLGSGWKNNFVMSKPPYGAGGYGIGGNTNMIIG